MRDVVRHISEQGGEPVIGHGRMKGRVPHPRADAQHFAVACQLVETGNFIDIDEVRRLRQPEGHDRHQALAAGQNAAVLARHLRQDRQRLIKCARHMADEGRWLHDGRSPKSLVC